MNILVKNKKIKLENLHQLFPNLEIIDVTSKGVYPWIKFSPFYPHGNIPVPYSTNCLSFSVEGIWQGLKVFQNSGIDVSKFSVTSMKGIKRNSKHYGKVLGHKRGLDFNDLLSYEKARHLIYLKSYRWVLDHFLQNEIEQIKKKATSDGVILLDYETNGDVENLIKPISHAMLIKKYIENTWPIYQMR